MAALQETNANNAQESEEKSGDGLSLGVHETKDGRLKVSIRSPALPQGMKRLPVILCCVVDTSGSMQLSATIKDAAGKEENTGITVLQLVKHAINTIIHCLDKDDYLSIVAYSSKATVVTQLMAMTESNKKKALKKLDKLQPDGQTNLWDGLHNGLEMMRKNKKLNAAQKNSAVLLFTDGMPNVTPPKGELGMLNQYVDTYGLPAAIHTYGFGYKLNTKLLGDVAKRGSGSFGFIPDSSMVGTIFVNSLSNICANMAKNVVLGVEADIKKYDVSVLGGFQTQETSWGVQITLGNVQYEQNRDVVLQFTPKEIEAKEDNDEDVMDDVEGQMDAIAITPSKMYDVGTQSLAYISLRSGEMVNGASQCVEDDKNGKLTDMHTYRLKMCDTLSECMKDAKINNLNMAQGRLKELIKEVQGNKGVMKEKYVEDLLEDLTGQAFEAVSKKEWYIKWGKHYIPSLVNAHLHQYCNNFKDPGVQHYGGTLFSKLKETGNAVFIELPAPKAEPYVSPYANMGGGGGGAQRAAAAAPVDMSQYYNVGGGCFHGDGQVLMSHGEFKSVRDLKVDDVVMGGAKVQCVVKHKAGKVQLCDYNGLVITPFHPIRVEGVWVFPADVGVQREYECEFVYNFVLTSGHLMTVDGVVACTLGHDFKGPVIEHAYFGTSKVKDDLSKLSGWTQGSVMLDHGAFRRNEDTQMVEGLVGV